MNRDLHVVGWGSWLVGQKMVLRRCRVGFSSAGSVQMGMRSDVVTD